MALRCRGGAAFVAAFLATGCGGGADAVTLVSFNATSAKDVLAHAAAAKADAEDAAAAAKRSITSGGTPLKSAGGMSEYEQFKQQQKIEEASTKAGTPSSAGKATSTAASSKPSAASQTSSWDSSHTSSTWDSHASSLDSHSSSWDAHVADWDRHKTSATSSSGASQKQAKASGHSHEDQEAVAKQIKALDRAQSALQYMEERAANKLKADTDEVDYLLHRQHALKDETAEHRDDVVILEAQAAKLKASGDSKDAASEAAELEAAAKTLKGSSTELQQLQVDIDSTTADGKRMDATTHELAVEREAVGRQVRSLERSREDMQEWAETAGDFHSFEKAGYDGARNDDDPYLKEAAAAMERASGWSKNGLDAAASASREALTKGISGKGGNAGQVLRGR
eukprot:TRINITY_DN18686_c0_g1_i1.p1 TRINITY_DN18686_c0_g1~~TRINITY_DN18686_c0_g1_i1.p1  ORF type:complete len:420 (-),score=114.51 TRINITY_DN18686_c0_g1_i1:222-1412(-)